MELLQYKRLFKSRRCRCSKTEFHPPRSKRRTRIPCFLKNNAPRPSIIFSLILHSWRVLFIALRSSAPILHRNSICSRQSAMNDLTKEYREEEQSIRTCIHKQAPQNRRKLAERGAVKRGPQTISYQANKLRTSHIKTVTD